MQKMHLVVVLPAGARRNERARGAHLQKQKKVITQQGGLGSGVFCCCDALFDTVIWFICVKFWIHDIFVRPQHPHGAENRFSEFATVFVAACVCGRVWWAARWGCGAIFGVNEAFDFFHGRPGRRTTSDD